MFQSVRLSLADLLGNTYVEKVAALQTELGFLTKEEAEAAAHEAVEFYPEAMQAMNDALLDKVGTQITAQFKNANKGAGTRAFAKATHLNEAPIGGVCNMRVGEDGKLYLIGKSEHYHASLGHRFNGYRLIDNARKLGIINATHNNTRGYITRLMEREVIRSINADENGDCSDARLEGILVSEAPKVLNRLINLETGSVAVEAGIKMMLSRFYKLDSSFDAPKYSGKIPVFFIMEDRDGTFEANYHGTSITAQTFRGMWPEFYKKADEAGIYKVVSVRINDIEDFRAKIEKYNSGDYKTAGFLHEIVLMNYGGVLLNKSYLQQAYKLCREYDTPTLVDEIQSCMWYEGMFLFRLYDLTPDFVVIGKGFPGGEYPASKIITTAPMDTLNQFGALVTNGQEELASLAYLITMTFMQANGDVIEQIGSRFETGLRRVMEKHSNIILDVEGEAHLAALHFHTVEDAAAFADKMKAACIDASAQIYKANCLPAMLMKPPIIASEATVDYIVNTIDTLLSK